MQLISKANIAGVIIGRYKMFGLYFAIIGLISGILCSIKAGEKNRNQKNWLLLGFIVPGITLILLNLLSINDKKEVIQSDNNREVSFINVY